MRFSTIGVIFAIIFLDLFLAYRMGFNVGRSQTLPLPPVYEPRPFNRHESPRPLPKRQFSASYTFSEKDQKCLALNIYWEARDQDLEGKIAIGLVTLQRVHSKYYPNTVCGVVWQKNKDKKTGRYVAQFSWTLDGRSDKPKNPIAWQRAKLIASFFASNPHLEDLTKGAYLYHAEYVKPYWKKHYQLTAKIGNHLFYK